MEELEKSGYYSLLEEQRDCVCHGECNQHNTLFTREGLAFTNFEHWKYELQTADLYQFMRKILEKHCWDQQLGKEMMKAYQFRRPLSDEEVLNLKLQLSYPWKYWKIANFYTNSNKVWISQKNTEKLEQTIQQMEPWRAFLDKFSK